MSPRAPLEATACLLKVDAILFDLDGVLVDSTGSVERLWRGFATDHALDADELLHDLHGRRMIDIMAAAVPHLGPKELAEQAARFDAAEAADAHRTDALPGARELTRDLDRQAVPWAVVTSGTDAVAAARIAAVGLARPPWLVTADQVRAGKPHPEPYLTAAERLGVEPARCLVVEDAPSGIRAGNAAGATTVAVTTSHRPQELAQADHQVDSVARLVLLRDHGAERARVAAGCSRHCPTYGARDAP